MAIYGITNAQQSTNESSFSYLDEMLNTIDCFDMLIEQLDDYQDDNEDYLNESIAEDIGDKFKYLITRIKEGKKEMLKQSTEAARQANDYKDQLNNVVSRDKAKGHIVGLYEQYVIYYTDGNTTVMYTEIRNAIFSGIALDFKEILNSIKNDPINAVKAKYRSFWKKAVDIYRFSPVIRKSSTKGHASEVAKALDNALSVQKELVEKFSKSLDKMENAVNEGMSIFNSNKGTPNIKWLKKYLTQQKRLYKHDFNIMYYNNLRVLRQSRACRDFIAKLNKN